MREPFITALQADRPGMLGVGIDFSNVMLAQARKRFDGDERVELVKHDLTEPLPDLGRPDMIVSSFVISSTSVSVCCTPESATGSGSRRRCSSASSRDEAGASLVAMTLEPEHACDSALRE